MESFLITTNNNDSYSIRLAQSYEYCALLARESGSNFYYGMMVTPKEKRLAMFAVYAWMREIDDIADSEDSKKNKIKQLLHFYKQTKAILRSNLNNEEYTLDKHWLAFRQTVLDFKIPLRYLKEMLYGQLQTVKHDYFKTFTDLYKYCYRVASTVGLICITIWGYKGGEGTKKLAEYRGIALQLTNILRDVYYDATAGQVYIPREFFANSDVSASSIMLKAHTRSLAKAINKIITKAAYYYKVSDPLEKYIEQDGLLCLTIMTDIYYALFRKIKRKPNIVLSNKKTRLNKVTKLCICLWAFVSFYFQGRRDRGFVSD